MYNIPYAICNIVLLHADAISKMMYNMVMHKRRNYKMIEMMTMMKTMMTMGKWKNMKMMKNENFDNDENEKDNAEMMNM